MSERIGDTSSIESVLHEERVFEPPAGFSESIGGAYISSMQQYRKMYARSIKDPEGFWAEFAQELDWFEKWTKVLQWKEPDAKWFLGGKTNVCHNCVDRQVNNGFGDQVAIIWEGEPTSAPKPLGRRWKSLKPSLRFAGSPTTTCCAR